ncbi:MAG TPA: TM0106 family RecB-like putative nuclease [Vitreimonas sp.]|nr:TM0106 family RecB-like putative nuclease [Vitreimonas sp.]
MHREDSGYRLSATDLVGHLGCRRLTQLSRALADGTIASPPIYSDPLLDALRERGRRHERAYVEYCARDGVRVADLTDLPRHDALAATRAAMQSGADVIVQGALSNGSWRGYPDVLRRVARPGRYGGWSYEVLDTKLSREAKAGAVLQIAFYSALLAFEQQAPPEHMYIVTPGDPFNELVFRVDDYAAFLRWAKANLAETMADAPAEHYPDPVAHCDVCQWSQACEQRRRDDDHLWFVAGIGKSQIRELTEHGVTTLGALADTPLPLPFKPARGARETYEKLREQARIQHEGRTAGRPVHELIALQPGLGLAALPAPSPGDIFLDFEGDTYAGDGGLEYLLGYLCADAGGALHYAALWATDPEEEKAAFERFIDFAMDRLTRHPELHIYHYGHYEPSALKRLMGRYASRERELDALLRGERFVDLLRVVRHGVRCSVESYSIKKLEAFYGFTRDAALPDANKSLGRVQAALELGEPLGELKADCDVVQRYNADDCRSTLELRTWLEALRQRAIEDGAEIARHEPKSGEANEDIAEQDRAIAELSARLCEDVPVDAAARAPDQHARWLLAQCLGWHRREFKAAIWEYYRLRDLSAEELMDERKAVSGLTLEGVVDHSTQGLPVHRYRFPPQECDLAAEDTVNAAGGGKVGAVHAISLEEGWIDIQKMKKTADQHPEAVFSYDDVKTDVLAAAVARIGDAKANDEAGRYPAAHALLARTPLLNGAPFVRESEDAQSAAIRVALSGARGVLPIQGPPGAGKTYVGARMICALAQAGKKVGVTANSHKVINNLLRAVQEAAEQQGIAVSCLQKTPQEFEPCGDIELTTKKNEVVLDGLDQGLDAIGGTAWLWACEDAENRVDVLFVDEAAQMSLANVLAVSHAAPLVVLLGDQQQLEQPSKASHPDGSDASALHHILDGAQTMPPHLGLFLPKTYRLHPDICRFTSELFYEGRLEPVRHLDRQTVTGALGRAGLRYLPVMHEGNSNCSLEEADAVVRLVRTLLRGKPTWTTRFGVREPLTLDEILIVTPYNAQVAELKRLLPDARIGTVDKFQGQEAPIVIYSMASSSSAEAPRGMEFLYSLNRLNVATSRAQCLCFLVASPAIFEPDCRSPWQMQLANALCRYRELAEAISL